MSVPNAPTNVRAVPYGVVGLINLQWDHLPTANTDVRGFYIKIRDENGNLVNTVNRAGSGFRYMDIDSTIHSLALNTLYSFTVEAYQIGGLNPGPPSTAVPGRLEQPPPQSPNQPTGLIATPGPGVGQVSLNWNISQNSIQIANYTIEYKNISTGTTLRKTTTNPATSIVLGAGDIYATATFIFKVRANADTVVGPFSDTAQAYAPQAPNTPTILTATSGPGSAEGQVRLDWSISQNTATITNYTINITTSGGTELTPVTTTGDETYIVLGTPRLTPGTTYNFTVRANAEISGSFSDSFTAYAPQAPHIPTILTATSGSGSEAGQVHLDWSISQNTATITNYTINITTSGGTELTPVTTTGDETYIVLGTPRLTPGTTYNFTVRANAEISGSFSNSFTAYAPEAPNIPTILTATSGPGPEAGQVRLDWSISQNTATIVNYTINITNATTGAVSFFDTLVSSNPPTYIVLGTPRLTPGTTYHFKVLARAEVSGSFSDSFTAYAPEAPNTPTGLIATDGPGAGEISIAWIAPSQNTAIITSYTIEITNATTGAVSFFDTLTSSNPTTSTVLDLSTGGINSGTSYNFRVRANAQILGSFSDFDTAYAPEAPNTPTGLIATAGPGAGEISLAWIAPSQNTVTITNYTINITTSGGSALNPVTTTDDETSIVLDSMNDIEIGTSYVFTVRAKAGTILGDPSTSAMAVARVAPNIPTDLRAALGPGAGQISLTWTAPSTNLAAVTNYTIEITAGGIQVTTVTTTDVETSIVLGSTVGTSYSFRVRANAGTVFGFFSTPTSRSTITVPCYAKGTKILTDKGYIKIEDIKKGDKVMREGSISKKGVLEKNKIKEVPVTWVSKFKIETLDSLSRPICIAKNAFGEDRPFENLYVSPGHSIMIDDRLITAKNLRNGDTIYPYNECESVEYYHVQCETHSAIYANGVLSETYIEWRKEFFDVIDYLQ